MVVDKSREICQYSALFKLLFGKKLLPMSSVGTGLGVATFPSIKARNDLLFRHVEIQSIINRDAELRTNQTVSKPLELSTKPVDTYQTMNKWEEDNLGGSAEPEKNDRHIEHPFLEMNKCSFLNN